MNGRSPCHEVSYKKSFARVVRFRYIYSTRCYYVPFGHLITKLKRIRLFEEKKSHFILDLSLTKKDTCLALHP